MRKLDKQGPGNLDRGEVNGLRSDRTVDEPLRQSPHMRSCIRAKVAAARFRRAALSSPRINWSTGSSRYSGN
jgi:hypothetical protein